MSTFNIYRLVCKAYFRQELSIDELATIFRDDLMRYEHETTSGIIRTFKTPYDAITAIIECEEESQLKAKKYAER